MSSGASLSGARRPTQVPTGTWCGRRRSCWRPKGCTTRRSPSGWGSRAKQSRRGEDVSARRGCRGLRRDRVRVGRGVFPPAQVAEVKALACELPAEKGVPLSRWSSAELAIEAVKRGIVATIAAVTIWRWLREDAIRPWNCRSWIFPRDPKFAEKAGRILDLYEGRWERQLLEPGDFVVCADEKPSIQARARNIPASLPRPVVTGSWSSTNTTARARSATSPRGMSAGPGCLIAAPPKTESSRLISSSSSSCRSRPTAARSACS